MDFQQKILSLAEIGPLQPVRTAKELKTDSFVASAMLSDLKSKGKLQISHLKIGSSPLYFLPQKKHQLENYADHLNEKEKKAFNLLKEKKIIRNSELDPLTKVCLQQLKDFAEPIQVSYQDKSEIFWKWYALNDNEFEEKVKLLITPLQVKEEKKEHKIEETKLETKQEVKLQTKEKIEEKKTELKQEAIVEKEEKTKKITEFQDEFSEFFEKNKIQIVDILSKRTGEKDLIIEIPSSVGNLTYFCKIKNKKSITDSDVSKAFLQGQSRKLPVLILSTGNTNKKAVELLNELRGVIFAKI
ncbi:hypothetical protein HZA97_05625 [Candidatus Woesearchaeota archaeon]|nr:hypothetical protein [Candidatus Woesearchaeota archaeon]